MVLESATRFAEIILGKQQLRAIFAHRRPLSVYMRRLIVRVCVCDTVIAGCVSMGQHMNLPRPLWRFGYIIKMRRQKGGSPCMFSYRTLNT